MLASLFEELAVKKAVWKKLVNPVKFVQNFLLCTE